MPPRTGPRRKRRVKAAPPLLPRHFAILRVDHTIEPVFVLSVELDDGHLVLRNQAGAIEQIVARGQWREIRPLGGPAQAEKPAPSTFANPTPGEALRAFEAATESREQATLTNENDLAFPPDPPERFVPNSPEEAQRILLEIERRLAPDYQDPPEDAPPVAPTPPRKD